MEPHGTSVSLGRHDAHSDPFQTRAVWDRMCRPSRRTKIDEGGNYLPFANITVVCHLDGPPPGPSGGTSHKLRSLPETLQKVAGGYLSPLPFDSYHATLTSGPLSCCQPSRQSWDAVMRHPCWKEMAEYLREASYAPEDLRFDPDFVHAPTWGGLLAVYFPHPSHLIRRRDDCAAAAAALTGSPYGVDDEADTVRGRIRTLGGGLMDEIAAPWHITLAYPLPYGGPDKNKHRDQPLMPGPVLAAVREAVTDAFLEYGGGPTSRPLPFHPARLCLSPDMTLFLPWDGLPPADTDEEGGTKRLTVS